MVLYSLKGLHIGISKIIFVLSLRVALVYISKGVQIGPANAYLEYDIIFFLLVEYDTCISAEHDFNYICFGLEKLA